MKDFKLSASNLVQSIETESDLNALQAALHQNGFGYGDSTSHEFKLRTIINVANKLNLTLPLNFTKQYWKLSEGSYKIFEKLIDKYFNQFSVNTRIEQLVKELLVTDLQQFPNQILYKKELEVKQKQGYEIVENKVDTGYVEFLTTVLIKPTVKFKSRHNSSKLEELYKLVTGEKADLPFIGDSTPKENNEVYQLYANRVFVFKSPAFNKALVPVVKKVVQQTSHATAFKSTI